MTTAASTSTTEQLVTELYRLTAIQRQWFRTAAAGLGLSAPTVAVLGAGRRLGPSRISDLAADVGVDLSVASRHVSALEAAGLVERAPDPSDRRAQLVALTAAGDALLTDAHRRLVAAYGAVLTDWTEDDVAALATGLGRLRADFDAGGSA